MAQDLLNDADVHTLLDSGEMSALRGKLSQPISIVLVDSSGTEGLLANWVQGVEVHPVTPLPAQVVLTRQGWVTPDPVPCQCSEAGCHSPHLLNALRTPRVFGGGTPIPQ
ncbi:hypothetical protein GCM10009525_51470 [Streptosporangium amethystogenes subsp. fukuiense]